MSEMYGSYVPCVTFGPDAPAAYTDSSPRSGLILHPAQADAAQTAENEAGLSPLDRLLIQCEELASDKAILLKACTEETNRADDAEAMVEVLVRSVVCLDTQRLAERERREKAEDALRREYRNIDFL